MRTSDLAKMTCTTAQSVDAIGDPWTLMILKELFLGTKKFDEFQAFTGVSPQLLSMRIRKLEKQRIIERKLYQKNPRRYEYKLTSKGIDLWPVMIALKQFSDRWKKWPKGRPLEIQHKECGHVTSGKMACAHCNEPIGAWNVTAIMSTEMIADRRAMSKKFQRKIKRA